MRDTILMFSPAQTIYHTRRRRRRRRRLVSPQKWVEI